MKAIRWLYSEQYTVYRVMRPGHIVPLELYGIPVEVAQLWVDQGAAEWYEEAKKPTKGKAIKEA
jgi:hypothetical protein